MHKSSCFPEISHLGGFIDKVTFYNLHKMRKKYLAKSFNLILTKVYWYFQKIIEWFSMEQAASKLMVRSYSQISPSGFEN